MVQFENVPRSARSAALDLFVRELDFYRADVSYLSAEKCAERCERLSAMLTAAAVLQARADRHKPVAQL